MSTTETCCYEGCTKIASEYDADGDYACEEHAAKSESYVEVVAFGGTWDADLAARYERWMDEHGWSLTVRESRRGEAEGTYRVKRDGGLQILGYSIPVPDSLRQDGNTGHDAVCGGWGLSSEAQAST